MPDEENDIRIREAADNYHPAYDETAWDKMEKLLDEHLPQKKSKRKFFFIIPILFLLGGLTLFILLDNGGKKTSESASISARENSPSPKLNEINQLSVNATEKSIKKPKNDQVTFEYNKSVLEIIPDSSRKAITEKAKIASVSPITSKISGQHNRKKNLSGQSIILFSLPTNKEVKNNNNEAQEGKPNSFVPNINEPFYKKNNITQETEKKPESSKTNKRNEIANKIEINKQDTIAKITNAKFEVSKKTKNKNNFKNNFGITFSAGTGISGVHVNNAGKISVVYGVGLSYSVSRKFTLRTGFYRSKKIYSVGPFDYHFPNGGSSNYGDLQSVDANCNVDEIPLNLYYNFGKMKNHNWFVSTGLSSYLMRRESYEFYYKTTAGDIYENDWSVKNKNKNIFSVLNLSAGYQHTFNKQFSIMAEPYINLPLSGIGAGKVKLNSGGVLFTIVMKPFLKNGK